MNPGHGTHEADFVGLMVRLTDEIDNWQPNSISRRSVVC